MSLVDTKSINFPNIPAGDLTVGSGASEKHRTRMYHTTTVLRARDEVLRKNGPVIKALHSLETPEMEVAPKWTRHAEEYVNPHLLPHERDPIAPRYGPDLPSQHVIPRSERCRCSWCKQPLGSKASERETEKGLKSLVKPVRAGAYLGQGVQGRSKYPPWADWDWNGQDSGPPSRTVSEINAMNPSAKPAPETATLDLMAMAKPAKVRGKKKIAQPTRDHTRAQTPSISLRPGSSMAGFSEIDGFSALDYEENWEHLDIDRLATELSRLEMEKDGANVDAFTDGTRSEWDWERFSQI